MYTANDIRNVEFTKNMGGYKINEVEAFVDSCADTVEALTSEKEELNKKLAILADKLVEYRRDEDSIRSALLSAQRMGDSVVREANDKAEKIIADATAEAESIIGNAKAGIAKYEAELARVQQEVSDFKATILSLYKDHLAVLKSIPEVEEEIVEEEVAPAPAPVAEPVQEQTVVAPVEEEEEDVKIAEGPVEPVKEAAPVVEQSRPKKSKFANLKFGEDYDIDEDDE